MRTAHSLSSSVCTSRVVTRPAVSSRVARRATPVLCQAKVQTQNNGEEPGRRNAIGMLGAAALLSGAAQPQAAPAEEGVPTETVEPENPFILTLGANELFSITTSPNPFVLVSKTQYTINIFNASKAMEHTISFEEFPFTTTSLQIPVPNAYGGSSMVEIKSTSVTSIKEIWLKPGARVFWTIVTQPTPNNDTATVSYTVRCSRHGLNNDSMQTKITVRPKP